MISEARANQACLLLGSNIAPEVNIPRAVQLLRQYVEVTEISKVWETPAVGTNGPNFLNAAVLVQTHLKPEQLKNQVLQTIEMHLGRVRTADKFASRPIDIDLIAWECNVTDPEVWQFAHVAVPVSEVLPCEIHSEIGVSLSEAATKLMYKTPIKLHGFFTDSLLELITNN